MIETERLLLRKFTMDDVEDAYQMHLDPEVRRFLPWEGSTHEEIAHLIEYHILGDYEKHGFGRLAVVHKKDNKFIGFNGLKYVEELDGIDIGYRLRRDYWGQGIATESSIPVMHYGFSQLKLERIIAGAVFGNDASIRVMKKLGMTYDKDVVIEGDPIHLYSATPSQFYNTHKISE